MMDPSWEERWQQKKTEAFPAPDPWLIKQRAHLNGKTALDLACGRGRNSLLLAQSGYQTLALDNSATALDLLKVAAEKNNLKIESLQVNLTSGLPQHPATVDLILCFYYLQRNLFPAIKDKISPAGLFIGRSFCQLEASTETNDIAYQPGELAQLFADWEILDYEEGIVTPNRSGTLAGIVARKPAAYLKSSNMK